MPFLSYTFFYVLNVYFLLVLKVTAIKLMVNSCIR